MNVKPLLLMKHMHIISLRSHDCCTLHLISDQISWYWYSWRSLLRLLINLWSFIGNSYTQWLHFNLHAWTLFISTILHFFIYYASQEYPLDLTGLNLQQMKNLPTQKRGLLICHTFNAFTQLSVFFVLARFKIHNANGGSKNSAVQGS